jgi:transglutaminase-like putative cysteine protease
MPNTNNYFAIATIWLLTMTVAFAQKDEYRELGHVKSSELTMTVYAPDSSADAVVLEDRGVTYLSKDDSRGYYIEYQRYTRIKILKKSGLEYANIQLLFYHFNGKESENFKGIEGRTYNGSQFTKMTDDAIFSEKKTNNYSLKKFTLPNVREGSVIEYTYTLQSDLIFNLREWNFQREIPIVRSDYMLYLIPGFEYRILFQGMNKMTDDENTRVSDGIKYHWSMENRPALRKELYTTTIEDYRSKVYFELIATNLYGSGRALYSKSWDDLDHTLITSGDFGAAMNKSTFVKDSIEVIRAATTDTLKRVEAVYDFVRRNMNFNEKGAYFINKSLKEAYQKRSGSAAEINLMLVAMLRELDLPANPVILSTRPNGLVAKDYPLLSKFDYVVAHIDLNGKDLLLDATDKFRRMGTLPFDCLNGEGRLIGKKSRWVVLKPAEKHSQVLTVSLQIMANGQFKGRVVQNYAGYAAAELRKKIFEINEDRFKEEIASNNPDWQMSNLNITNLNN